MLFSTTSTQGVTHRWTFCPINAGAPGSYACVVPQCETELTATRAQDVPNVFETIQIHFKVTGRNLDAKKVARAVKLSAEKYCSASIMLERGGVDISHTHKIIDVPSEAPE